MTDFAGAVRLAGVAFEVTDALGSPLPANARTLRGGEDKN